MANTYNRFFPLMESDDFNSIFADALARGEQMKPILLADAGGTYSVDEVAALLGLSIDEVEILAEESGLLGIPTETGSTIFPLCQFNGNNVVDGLQLVLAAFNVK